MSSLEYLKIWYTRYRVMYIYRMIYILYVCTNRFAGYMYIKLIKIKERQQVGIKGPKFSANAFLGDLFLTTERG